MLKISKMNVLVEHHRTVVAGVGEEVLEVITLKMLIY